MTNKPVDRESQIEDKVEKIIERWGRHTSEGGDYWNYYEKPDPLKELVADLISTIKREAVKEGKEQMIEWIKYELALAKQEGIDIGEGEDPRLRVNYLISKLELIVEKTSRKGRNYE